MFTSYPLYLYLLSGPLNEIYFFDYVHVDLKTMTPQNCVQSLETLIVDIQHKWPNTEIIVSLATPRKDNLKFHTNGQIINALIKEKIISYPHKDFLL
jgi:hypothetical protein